MSRKISLLFVMLALCASSVVVQAANWQRFSPSGGKFTVSFPGAPKTTVKKKNASENVFNQHIYMFTLKGENTKKIEEKKLALLDPRSKKKDAAFLLQYFDVSEKHRKTRTDREWLNGLQERVSNKANREIVTKNTFRVSGYLARSLILKDGKNFYHLLLVLARNRIYNVMVLTEEEKSRHPKRFINSFRILK